MTPSSQEMAGARLGPCRGAMEIPSRYSFDDCGGVRREVAAYRQCVGSVGVQCHGSDYRLDAEFLGGCRSALSERGRYAFRGALCFVERAVPCRRRWWL